ncbi:transcription factor VIP1-like [Pyrus ussuriensis x Pyrus communis]|uniref:Transcription factor VIP1-like n=1 Tax=Pyrus ussuriensis x Pyrus communis TaxID=2448454 RepID=A0A5N5I182_9ROSA|nr:transcription factor VIP1-like [Pyrus ussuriensis x Pyrus communis]
MVSQTICNMLNSPGASVSGNSSASTTKILGIRIKNPEIQNVEVPYLPSERDEEKGLGSWPIEESSDSRNMAEG